MTLKFSVVIFQALESLQPQLPQQPQFIKNLLILMIGFCLPFQRSQLDFPRGYIPAGKY